jgi:hypothetical protein
MEAAEKWWRRPGGGRDGPTVVAEAQSVEMVGAAIAPEMAGVAGFVVAEAGLARAAGVALEMVGAARRRWGWAWRRLC